MFIGLCIIFIQLFIHSNCVPFSKLPEVMHRRGTSRKTVNLAIKCFTINIPHKRGEEKNQCILRQLAFSRRLFASYHTVLDSSNQYFHFIYKHVIAKYKNYSLVFENLCAIKLLKQYKPDRP